jgi:hypothetical protein
MLRILLWCTKHRWVRYIAHATAAFADLHVYVQLDALILHPKSPILVQPRELRNAKFLDWESFPTCVPIRAVVV